MHFSFFGLVFALQGLQLKDLSFVEGPALQAGSSIHVYFQASLDVPLNSLAEPAVLQSLAHLEADYFVAEFHKVVKDGEVRLFKFSVKQVTLDHVHRGVPNLLLSEHFALFHLSILAQRARVIRILNDHNVLFRYFHLAAAASTPAVMIAAATTSVRVLIASSISVCSYLIHD